MKNRQAVIVVLYLTVFSVATFASAATDVDNDWKQKIATEAQAELERNGVPSLQLAIGYKGDVIFEGAYGLADVENRVLATRDSMYRTASVSKWMTATAAMRLVEQGILNLDAPIQTYCPQYPEKQWQITARHLLTHTSGIRHYADYESELSHAETDAERVEIERRRDRDLLGRYTRYTNITDTLKSFKNDPLRFEPGTNWLYSSYGYRVLGCVLEGAAGRPYRTVMQSEVFEKSGMTRMTFDDAWTITQNRASGYRISEGQPIRRADMRDVSENLPAGGHLSTASDLLAFALAFEAEELVSGRSISIMSEPILAELDEMPSTPPWRDLQPSERKYGYGVMLFPTSEGIWRGHTGQQAGASSIVMQSPDQSISIAVLTNAKGWRGYISFTESIRTILSEEFSEQK